MTDEQIIKALECCSYATYNSDCEKCPYYPDEECVKKQCTDILDLIKRKDAEIEQWKEEANKYQNNWCESVKEIERLEKDRYIFKDGVLELIPRTDIEEIKSEAIKEFAERLTDIFPLLEALPKAMDIVMKEMGLKEE